MFKFAWEQCCSDGATSSSYGSHHWGRVPGGTAAIVKDMDGSDYALLTNYDRHGDGLIEAIYVLIHDIKYAIDSADLSAMPSTLIWSVLSKRRAILFPIKRTYHYNNISWYQNWGAKLISRCERTMMCVNWNWFDLSEVDFGESGWFLAIVVDGGIGWRGEWDNIGRRPHHLSSAPIFHQQ